MSAALSALSFILAFILCSAGILLPLYLTRELEEPMYAQEYQDLFQDLWDED